METLKIGHCTTIFINSRSKTFKFFVLIMLFLPTSPGIGHIVLDNVYKLEVCRYFFTTQMHNAHCLLNKLHFVIKQLTIFVFYVVICGTAKNRVVMKSTFFNFIQSIGQNRTKSDKTGRTIPTRRK